MGERCRSDVSSVLISNGADDGSRSSHKLDVSCGHGHVVSVFICRR